MKQSKISNCLLCKKGVLHENNLMFYRISIETLIADLGAIQRAAGLEMMVGGDTALARIMGPDEDIAKTVTTMDGLVCLPCLARASLGALLEVAANDEGAAAEARDG